MAGLSFDLAQTEITLHLLNAFKFCTDICGSQLMYAQNKLHL